MRAANGCDGLPSREPAGYNDRHMRDLTRIVVVGLFVVGLAAAQLSPLEQPKAAASDATPPPSNALDKDDLAFYVRHLFVYGPQISLAVGEFEKSDVPGLLETTVTASYKLASKKHVFFVSEDGKHIFEGKTYQVDKNPFDEVNKTIDTLSAPTFGKEGASVVVVAYSDFQCPYCAQEARVLRSQLLNGYADKVRVYFRDFPLDMHDWAKPAAAAGRCIYMQEPDTFWAYHDWIFEEQKNVTPGNIQDKAAAWATEKGLDGAKVAACMAEPKTLEQVEASLAEGRAVGVSSTPTLYVNGRQLTGSVKWEQLKQIIDFELDYQEVTHNAGDDCGCVVEAEFPK